MGGSSIEAKHITVSGACNDGSNIYHSLYGSMQVNLTTPMQMDNQGVTHMANNLVINKRPKRIDLKCRLIRESVKIRVIKLEYISSEQNTAAILTKPLQKENRNGFTNMLLQDRER